MEEKQGGFLLIENLLAIVIVAVALVAGIGVFISAQRALAVSAGQTGAVYLAQKQAEMLKATRTTAEWNAMYPQLVQSNMPILWQDNQDTIPINLNQWNYRVETIASTCSDSDALVEVTIRVMWQERNADRQYTLVVQYPRY